ncbi:hypothetical protein DY000_02014599 [Brassica cretica]|uniref:Uncharacterized protein n=1 Tax=Brassica cretica TaxID=69181 RepID=A0ABQ7CUB5_BRACR|nr:hypothetical protein DY000_02014599 [Brassica cretica]
MPNSTRSNKESQLIFSPDPASLERTIRRSTSIDTEPRAMVTPLILVRDNNGDLHDQEGHLRNAVDGGIENSFKQRSRNTTHPSINKDVPTVTRQPEFTRRAFDPYGNRKFYWQEKNEYGVYRDDREFARDLDGHTIPVHNKDIRRLLERASKDEPSYICLPEHASQFTQTNMVPEIHTKDEINEMFYGVFGEHDRNKEAFQMKLDGVYYPLNDSISWLTTCMEEMKQDIARIQNATDVARPPSIDRRRPQSIYFRQSPSLDIHHHASIDNRLAASIVGTRIHTIEIC